MKKLTNYKGYIILGLLIILICLFPLTGKDLFWSNDAFSLKDLLFESNGSIISSLYLYISSHSIILKIIISFIFFLGLLLSFKDIVNPKNKVLFYISTFLFLVLDKIFIAQNLVNLTGYMQYGLGMLVLLILINTLAKSSYEKLNYPLVILLGIIATSTFLPSSIVIFVLTLVKMIFELKYTKKTKLLFVGETIGLTASILIANFTHPNIYSNLTTLLNNLIGSNFILTFILGAFILFVNIKVNSKNIKYLSLYSLLVIQYLLISLINSNTFILLISFILSTVSSYIIIQKMTKNSLIKRKMNYIFLSKILGFLVSILLKDYNYFLMLNSITNIVVIIEIYNYFLPNNYLNLVWFIASALLLVTDIYLYSKVVIRFNDMNNYIKETLTEENTCIIPKRFETDYLYDYIPNTKQELKWYLNYYKINVNEENITIEFQR